MGVTLDAAEKSALRDSTGERSGEQAEQILDEHEELARGTKLIVGLTVAHRVVRTGLGGSPQRGTGGEECRPFTKFGRNRIEQDPDTHEAATRAGRPPTLGNDCSRGPQCSQMTQAESLSRVSAAGRVPQAGPGLGE